MKTTRVCRLFIPFILSVSFIALSCKNDNRLVVPTLTTPLVAGLWVTDSSGPDVIAQWGNPSDPYGSQIRSSTARQNNGGVVATGAYAFDHPFPNPAPGATVITLFLPSRSVVDLWVVGARWVNDAGSDETVEGGAVAITPQRSVVDVILEKDTLNAGVYTLIWGGTLNGHVAPGFYRIYFRANGVLAWHDIFTYRDLSDMPISLRKLVGH